MKVLERGKMEDGTDIQIEDWHENYDFMPKASTIATYPKAKESHDGLYSPKRHERFRCAFNFSSSEEAREAFDQLASGEKKLINFVSKMNEPKYADCL